MIFKNFERIVFAGDSVTDMGSEHPIGETPVSSIGNGYVRAIENNLYAYYPELNLRITNSGIACDTSKDLLARFDRDVISLQPDWVSICIGINDVWHFFGQPALKETLVQIDEYEKNLEEMILRSKKTAKGVILATPYYIAPQRSDPMRDMMDEYGAVCKRLAEKYKCVFVDLQKEFDEYCKYKHSSTVSLDRVHPNAIGATVQAKAFLKAFKFDFAR